MSKLIPCKRNKRCAERNGQNVPHQARPFCHSDDETFNAIMTLDIQLIRLELALSLTKKGGGSGGGAKAPHPPLLINAEVDAITRELDLAVATWYEILTEQEPARFGTMAATLGVGRHRLYDLPRTPIMRWRNGQPVLVEMSGIAAAIELWNLNTRGAQLLR